MTKRVSDSIGFSVNLLEFLYHSIPTLNQNKLGLKHQATYIDTVLQKKPRKWVRTFVCVCRDYHTTPF